MSVDFNYVLRTEGSTFYDAAELQIDTGLGWQTLAAYNGVAESSTWTAAEPVELSDYAGQSVRLRWFFDTIDSFANSFEGWYVDDIRIQAAPLEEVDVYAFSLAKGQSATIAAKGLEGDDLRIEVVDEYGNVVATGIPDLDLIENGSFETGDFTGWTKNTISTPTIDWTVSVAGTGAGFGFAPLEPQDGQFVAWNSFDSFAAPMEFILFQDLSIPADIPQATLTWQDRVQWDFTLWRTGHHRAYL